MLYGIFADVHANLEALQAVMGFFKSQRVSHYLCSGDAVGYGPNPNECVRILRGLEPLLHNVVGNHDWAACGLKDTIWFNEYARKALNWTQQILSLNNQIYLSELPKTLSYGEFTLVHGTPRNPLDEYFMSAQQFKENEELLTTPITIIGNTHVPCYYTKAGGGTLKDGEVLTIDPNERCVINPGSVGQPRDGDHRACCGMYDTATRQFRLYRIDYDFAVTQDKMRKARLPAFLIERLAWGN